MRDLKRIKRILKLIEQLWLKSPDERFGQFMINRGIMQDDWRLWEREDDEWELYLKRWQKKQK